MPSPVPEIQEETTTGYIPRYRVILHDDNQHTYEYVIEMVISIFGMTQENALRVAKTVDEEGQASCGVFPLEVAELKQEQIHEYGPDPYLEESSRSMVSSIERE